MTSESRTGKFSAEMRERAVRMVREHRCEHAAGWGTVFGDPVVATAILDRLLHHSHVLTIRGDSYWLHAKRRRGLIKAQPHGDNQPTS